MDKNEIKRQIAYWEAMQKENESQIKVRTEQNKSIKATLKFLKSLTGKDSNSAPELEASLAEYDSEHGGE
jgi:hypothetical protein